MALADKIIIETAVTFVTLEDSRLFSLSFADVFLRFSIIAVLILGLQNRESVGMEWLATASSPTESDFRLHITSGELSL